jgi:hypothetical protein
MAGALYVADPCLFPWLVLLSWIFVDIQIRWSLEGRPLHFHISES